MHRQEIKAVKLYDFNGTLIDLRPFWPWLQEHHAILYHEYKILGETDVRYKKKHKAEIVRIMEDASINCSYPQVPIDHAQSRLRIDYSAGCLPIIFTTMPKDTVMRVAKNTSLDELISEGQVLPLDQVLEAADLPPNTT